MNTCYYYQSFVGLDKILTHPKDLDILIISSIHFGKTKENKNYIHLNDNDPNNTMFNKLWDETKELSEKGTTIMCMMGGAGGAYQTLFSDFKVYYPLLVKMIKDRPWIKGIDIDIEEEVDIKNVKHLIDQLDHDFGKEFIITMAPLGSSLEKDGGSMGGFNYKELYDSEQGKRINWFNCQCYYEYTVDIIDNITKNGYPPEKIIMGMESGQFTDSSFLKNIQGMKKKYPKLKGVYDWEYLNAPPDKTDPSQWCKLIKEIH